MAKLKFRSKEDLGYDRVIYRGQLVVFDEVKDDEEFLEELHAHDSGLFIGENEKPAKKRAAVKTVEKKTDETTGNGDNAPKE